MVVIAQVLVQVLMGLLSKANSSQILVAFSKRDIRITWKYVEYLRIHMQPTPDQGVLLVTMSGHVRTRNSCTSWNVLTNNNHSYNMIISKLGCHVQRCSQLTVKFHWVCSVQPAWSQQQSISAAHIPRSAAAAAEATHVGISQQLLLQLPPSLC